MKIWIGGELQKEIMDDFRVARKEVESALNAVILNKTYPLNVRSLDVIIVLRDDDVFEEITKYSLKSGEMDFRLKMEFRAFHRGTPVIREKMIFDAIMRALFLLENKGASKEGINQVKKDIIEIGRGRDWIGAGWA